MFNSVTANSLKTLPPVEGVDRERIPQILTKVYAHIVGLKTKYEIGVLNFEQKEIDEDCRLLGNLAFTLELYLESGKFANQNDAIAFVAAMSHKLLGKLKDQKPKSLTCYEMPSDLVSVLLFVIGGYIADAEELSYGIKKGEEESEAAWLLKQNIILLVRGKLSKIINASELKEENDNIEDYAQDLLWNYLAMGIKKMSFMLLGSGNGDYAKYFKRVIELSVFVDNTTNIKYDYTGISRLARLLLMASNVLEEQSVLKVVNSHVESIKPCNLLLNIASRRPYLWRNHIDAIEKGVLDKGKSSVITFPTGAGKSTLIELKIIQHIASGTKVIYIVPTHALEYQVKDNMNQLLDSESYKNLNIGREFTTESEEEAPVLVMTPERCSTLLTLNPMSFDGTTLVIMDEFHIIGDGGHRSLGAMYCIVSLLSILPQADFMFVSAMVENGYEMADWIEYVTNRECLNLSMAWKPTSQLQGCIVYHNDKITELMRLVGEDKRIKGTRKSPSAELKRRLIATPYCMFSLCNTWESNYSKDYYLTPILDHKVKLGVNKFWVLNGNKNQVAKELAKKFAAIEMKTIVFVENPPQSNSLVKQLNTETRVEQLPANLQKKKNSIVEELGDVSCSYLKDEMGAVPHHSLLLPEERHVMEALFREGSNIMIATPTLAQGVNLPVDVVLIAGEDRYDAETKGRDRMDAHEILNAAGRAGRAGFRSQGAAILVSNKVIGIQDKTLTKDWFDLKNEIFSKGDQCLKIEDPFGKLAESTVADEEMSTEQKIVLMKLNLLGENEKKVLSKSLYAYQLKRDQNDVSAFEERIMNLSSLYEGEEGSPLMELSLKTGVGIQLLDAFYEWLGDKEQDEDFSVGFLLKLYCKWLYQMPEALRELLTYKQTLDTLLDLFGKDKKLDGNFIIDLCKVLKKYVNGCSLKEISDLLNENDDYLNVTRKFVLKVIPELSYAFSVLTMVHIQYLKDIGWGDDVMPTNLKNFATYLKEGVTSDDMLKYKIDNQLMRVEAHRLYNSLEK